MKKKNYHELRAERLFYPEDVSIPSLLASIVQDAANNSTTSPAAEPLSSSQGGNSTSPSAKSLSSPAHLTTMTSVLNKIIKMRTKASKAEAASSIKSGIDGDFLDLQLLLSHFGKLCDGSHAVYQHSSSASPSMGSSSVAVGMPVPLNYHRCVASPEGQMWSESLNRVLAEDSSDVANFASSLSLAERCISEFYGDVVEQISAASATFKEELGQFDEDEDAAMVEESLGKSDDGRTGAVAVASCDNTALLKDNSLSRNVRCFVVGCMHAPQTKDGVTSEASAFPPAMVIEWDANSEVPHILRGALSTLSHALTRTQLRCACRTPYLSLLHLSGKVYGVMLLVPLSERVLSSKAKDHLDILNVVKTVVQKGGSVSRKGSLGLFEDHIVLRSSRDGMTYLNFRNDGSSAELRGLLVSLRSARLESSSGLQRLVNHTVSSSTARHSPPQENIVGSPSSRSIPKISGTSKKELFSELCKVFTVICGALVEHMTNASDASSVMDVVVELIMGDLCGNVIHYLGLRVRDLGHIHKVVVAGIQDEESCRVAALPQLRPTSASLRALEKLIVCDMMYRTLREVISITASFLLEQKRYWEQERWKEEEVVLADHESDMDFSKLQSTDFEMYLFATKLEELKIRPDPDVVGDLYSVKNKQEVMALLAVNGTLRGFLYEPEFCPFILSRLRAKFTGTSSTQHLSSLVVDENTNIVTILPVGAIIARVAEKFGATLQEKPTTHVTLTTTEAQIERAVQLYSTASSYGAFKSTTSPSHAAHPFTPTPTFSAMEDTMMLTASVAGGSGSRRRSSLRLEQQAKGSSEETLGSSFTSNVSHRMFVSTFPVRWSHSSNRRLVKVTLFLWVETQFPRCAVAKVLFEAALESAHMSLDSIAVSYSNDEVESQQQQQQQQENRGGNETQEKLPPMLSATVSVAEYSRLGTYGSGVDSSGSEKLFIEAMEAPFFSSIFEGKAFVYQRMSAIAALRWSSAISQQKGELISRKMRAATLKALSFANMTAQHTTKDGSWSNALICAQTQYLLARLAEASSRHCKVGSIVDKQENERRRSSAMRRRTSVFVTVGTSEQGATTVTGSYNHYVTASDALRCFDTVVQEEDNDFNPKLSNSMFRTLCIAIQSTKDAEQRELLMNRALSLSEGDPIRAVDHGKLLLELSQEMMARSEVADQEHAKKDQDIDAARRNQTSAFICILPQITLAVGRSKLHSSAEVYTQFPLIEGRKGRYDPNHVVLRTEIRNLSKRLLQNRETEHELQSMGLYIDVLGSTSTLAADLNLPHEAFACSKKAHEIVSVAYGINHDVRRRMTTLLDTVRRQRTRHCTLVANNRIKAYFKWFKNTSMERKVHRKEIEDNAFQAFEECRSEENSLWISKLDVFQQGCISAQHSSLSKRLRIQEHLHFAQILSREDVEGSEERSRWYLYRQVDTLRNCREVLRSNRIEQDYWWNQQESARTDVRREEYCHFCIILKLESMEINWKRLESDLAHLTRTEAFEFQRLASDHYFSLHRELLQLAGDLLKLEHKEIIQRATIVKSQVVVFRLGAVAVRALLESEETGRIDLIQTEGSEYFFMTRSFISSITATALHESMELIELEEFDGRMTITKEDVMFWQRLRAVRRFLTTEEAARNSLEVRKQASFTIDVVIPEIIGRESITRARFNKISTRESAALRAVLSEPKKRAQVQNDMFKKLMRTQFDVLLDEEAATRAQLMLVEEPLTLEALNFFGKEDHGRSFIHAEYTTFFYSRMTELFDMDEILAHMSTTVLEERHRKIKLFLLERLESIKRVHLQAKLFFKPFISFQKEFGPETTRMKVYSNAFVTKRYLQQLCTLERKETGDRFFLSRLALQLQAQVVLPTIAFYDRHAKMESLNFRWIVGASRIYVSEQKIFANALQPVSLSLNLVVHHEITQVQLLKQANIICREMESRGVLRGQQEVAHVELLEIIDITRLATSTSTVRALIKKQSTKGTPTGQEHANEMVSEEVEEVVVGEEEEDVEQFIRACKVGEYYGRKFVADAEDIEHSTIQTLYSIITDEMDARNIIVTDDAGGITMLRKMIPPDFTLSWIALTKDMRKMIENATKPKLKEQYQSICLHPNLKGVDWVQYTEGPEITVLHRTGAVTTLVELCDNVLGGHFTVSQLLQFNPTLKNKLKLALAEEEPRHHAQHLASELSPSSVKPASRIGSAATSRRTSMAAAGCLSPSASSLRHSLSPEQKKHQQTALVQAVAVCPLRVTEYVSLKMPALQAAAYLLSTQMQHFQDAESVAKFTSAILSGSTTRVLAAAGRETAAGKLWDIQQREELDRVYMERLAEVEVQELGKRFTFYCFEVSSGAVQLQLRHMNDYRLIWQQQEAIFASYIVLEKEDMPRLNMVMQRARYMARLKKREMRLRPPKDGAKKLCELVALGADVVETRMRMEYAEAVAEDIEKQRRDIAEEQRTSRPPSRTITSNIGRGGGNSGAVYNNNGLMPRIALGSTRNLLHAPGSNTPPSLASQAVTPRLPPLQIPSAMELATKGFPSLSFLVKIVQRDVTTSRIGLSTYTAYAAAVGDAAQIYAEFATMWFRIAATALLRYRELKIEDWRFQCVEGIDVVKVQRVVLVQHREAVHQEYQRGMHALQRVHIERMEHKVRELLLNSEPVYRDRIAQEFQDDLQILLMIQSVRKTAAGGSLRRPRHKRKAPSSANAYNARNSRNIIEMKPAEPIRPMIPDSSFAEVYKSLGNDIGAVQSHFEQRDRDLIKCEAERNHSLLSEFVMANESRWNSAYSSEEVTPIVRQGVFCPNTKPFSGSKQHSATPNPKTLPTTCVPMSVVAGSVRPSTAMNIRQTRPLGSANAHGRNKGKK